MCPRPREALTGGPVQGMSVWATLGTALCLIPDRVLSYSPSPNTPSTDIWQEFGDCSHSMLLAYGGLHNPNSKENTALSKVELWQ